jgi:membrane protease YdiL (CAAX protease family)
MDTTAMQRRQFLILVLLSELVLAALAIGFGWLLDVPPLAQMSWSWPAVGQGALASLPMIVALVLMKRWPIGPLRFLLELVETHLLPHLRQCSLVDLMLISLSAGLGEELLFRGVLQTAVARWTGSVAAGIGLASLAFGAVHAVSTTYFVLAGLIGAYLGCLFVATDNLVPPILTHAIYDFVALVYLLRGAPVRHEEPEPATSESS